MARLTKKQEDTMLDKAKRTLEKIEFNIDSVLNGKHCTKE